MWIDTPEMEKALHTLKFSVRLVQMETLFWFSDLVSIKIVACAVVFVEPEMHSLVLLWLQGIIDPHVTHLSQVLPKECLIDTPSFFIW